MLKIIKTLLRSLWERFVIDPQPPKLGSPCEWCQRPAGCCDCRDRIDCHAVGTLLHQTCGWCGACDVPMFMCPAAHWRRRRLR